MARRRRGAGSESAGYHYGATPKRPAPTRTPVVAPSKRQAARGPAGDYAGANKDFAAAVATLPAPARRATEAATVAATKRQARASGASRRRANRAAQAERRRQSAVLADVQRSRRRRQALRGSANPAKAILSSRPNPLAKPAAFSGKPTAGEPTRGELQKAKRQGTLRVNQKGFVTTPAVRQAATDLRAVQAKIAKHGPDLSNLTPAEAEVARLAQHAHRKYPALPVPVAMAQVKQESGFNAGAVSSAGAEGLTQFIPSTAASYGVKFGTGKPEKRSQVLGQFKLMEDNLRQSGGDLTTALNSYLGLAGQTTPSQYSANILGMAKGYRGLGKPALPKGLRRQARAARQQAARVGLKGSKPKGIVGHAPKKIVTRYKAGLAAMRELEKAGFPYSWGGGHDAQFAPGGEQENGGPGYDCSGSVSFVLHKMGVLSEPLTSGSMGSVLESGPGVFTVFYNADHTFIRVLTKNGPIYWGTSVGDSGAGGIGRHPMPSASYLAQYSVGHVPGLGKKLAMQLGLPGAQQIGSEGSFAGVTFSNGGATATIDPAAAAVKSGKPGFSKKPIKLTPLQRYNRNKRKLRAIGLPLGSKAKQRQPQTHPVLQELIEKYGSANPVPTNAAERKAKALAAATK